MNLLRGILFILLIIEIYAQNTFLAPKNQDSKIIRIEFLRAKIQKLEAKISNHPTWEEFKPIVSDFKILVMELQQTYRNLETLLKKDSRPCFQIIIPVYKSADEVENFLISLKEELESFNYPKDNISIVIMEDGLNEKEQIKHQQVIKKYQNIFNIEYFAEDKQAKLVFGKQIDFLVEGQNGYLGKSHGNKDNMRLLIAKEKAKTAQDNPPYTLFLDSDVRFGEKFENQQTILTYHMNHVRSFFHSIENLINRKNNEQSEQTWDVLAGNVRGSPDVYTTLIHIFPKVLEYIKNNDSVFFRTELIEKGNPLFEEFFRSAFGNFRIPLHPLFNSHKPRNIFAEKPTSLAVTLISPNFLKKPVPFIFRGRSEDAVWHHTIKNSEFSSFQTGYFGIAHIPGERFESQEFSQNTIESIKATIITTLFYEFSENPDNIPSQFFHLDGVTQLETNVTLMNLLKAEIRLLTKNLFQYYYWCQSFDEKPHWNDFMKFEDQIKKILIWLLDEKSLEDMVEVFRKLNIDKYFPQKN